MSNISANFTIFIVLTLNYFCVSKLIRVSTSDDFKAALLEVSPGDNISLVGNNSTFHGNFIAIKNGSRTMPITILTENFLVVNLHAQIIGEGKTAATGKREAALTIAGDHYNLENLKIGNNHSIGLLLLGANSSITGAEIQDSETGIWIKGTPSYLKDCRISNVESGIQVDGDFSIIRNTVVKGAGIVSLAAGKNTCCGNLAWNAFDGRVDIRGTDYNLWDNVIEGKSQEKAIVT